MLLVSVKGRVLRVSKPESRAQLLFIDDGRDLHLIQTGNMRGNDAKVLR